MSMRFSVASCFVIVPVLSVAAAIFLTGSVLADDRLLPKIPAAKGDQCVEPTEVMRRRHMEFILHQRDETVHRGIRTKKHSFVNCINCHVQARKDGTYPRHADADHFCQDCHRFSSVSVDCFQCHADRPVAAYGAMIDNARKWLSLYDE